MHISHIHGRSCVQIADLCRLDRGLVRFVILGRVSTVLPLQLVRLQRRPRLNINRRIPQGYLIDVSHVRLLHERVLLIGIV